MGDPVDRAVQKVLDAWRVEGPAPMYHRVAKAQLAQSWPALYKALEELDRSSR